VNLLWLPRFFVSKIFCMAALLLPTMPYPTSFGQIAIPPPAMTSKTRRTSPAISIRGMLVSDVRIRKFSLGLQIIMGWRTRSGECMRRRSTF
jgi:hypothetical protein